MKSLRWSGVEVRSDHDMDMDMDIDIHSDRRVLAIPIHVRARKERDKTSELRSSGRLSSTLLAADHVIVCR